MHVKVIDQKSGKVTLYDKCSKLEKEDTGDGTLVVRLFPGGEVITLPDDGDVVYVESEKGGTTITFRISDRERDQERESVLRVVRE